MEYQFDRVVERQHVTVTERDGFARTSVAAPTAGRIIYVDIDRVGVAVADLGGELAAFDDTCTHRECPLSEGTIVDASVICPCHKSRFDLRTGQPLNGPATQPIRIRVVRVEDGHLVIER